MQKNLENNSNAAADEEKRLEELLKQAEEEATLPALISKKKKKKRSPENGANKRWTSSPVQCQLCDKSFAKAHAYFGHLHSHSKEPSRLRCGDQNCDFSSSSMSALWRHQRRQHDRSSLHQCDLCPAAFHKPSQLRSHREETHDRIRQFQCHLCSSSLFYRRSDLRQHLRVHLGIKRHTCEVCGKNFSHVSNLKRHSSVHTGLKAFACDVCGKAFQQSSGLAKHAGRHSFFVQCSICGKRLSHVDVYRKHLRSVHKVVEVRDFVLDATAKKVVNGCCDLAGLQASSKDPKPSRQNHDVSARETIEERDSNADVFMVTVAIEREDDEEEAAVELIEVLPEASSKKKLENTAAQIKAAYVKEVKSKPKRDKKQLLFACSVCSKHFRRQASLVQHLGTHSDENKLQCKECDGLFAWKTTLNRHIWAQHGKDCSGFDCSKCKKTFQTKSVLQMHVRRDHLNERQFQCDKCDRAFFKKDDLRTHSKVHSGQRSYLCNQCGKSFSHVSNLKRHSKVHLGIREFQCIICDKWFTQKHALQEHDKRYH